MIRRVYSFVLVSSLLLVLSSTAQASFVTIDNSSNAGNVNFFGRDDASTPSSLRVTATYGQTFLAPDATHTVLNSWSFFLDADLSTSPFTSALTFDFYVMEWGGNSATGPNLLSAPIRRNTDTVSGFQEFNFNTGNLQLDPLKTYIAFVTTTDVAGLGLARANVAGNVGYSSGSFRFIDNNDDESQWFSESWGALSGGAQDLAFTATFSDPTAIPEPTSLALVGIVSCVAAGRVAVRRRRRAGVPASAGRSQFG